MSSIPTHLKDLLKSLEFLAMIEKGKKPCLSDMTFVDAASWSGAWWRSRHSESKKDLLNFIDNIIDQTFTAIKDSRNREYIPFLISSLSRAHLGVSNTLLTYQKYPSFTTHIKVVLKNIELNLKSYDPLLESPVHNTSSPQSNTPGATASSQGSLQNPPQHSIPPPPSRG